MADGSPGDLPKGRSKQSNQTEIRKQKQDFGRMYDWRIAGLQTWLKSYRFLAFESLRGSKVPDFFSRVIPCFG
ncbi:MAG: hypothetical protein AAB316_15580 [Bacteroidota bacterium]